MDIMHCPFDGCSARFTGEYRKGNLGRHRRQKHAGQVLCYPCQGERCTRVFQRKDARLKHHRKAHPDLNVGPATQRKLSSSLGSDWIDTNHVQTSHDHVSSYGDQEGFDGDVSSYNDVQSHQDLFPTVDWAGEFLNL